MVRNIDLARELFKYGEIEELEKEKKNLEKDEKAMLRKYYPKFIKIFEEWVRSYKITLDDSYLYSVARKIIKGNKLYDYTLKTVELFVQSVPRIAAKLEEGSVLTIGYILAYEDLGILISALINEIIDKNDTVILDVGEWKYPPNFLGYQLPYGKITIKGNVGNKVGMHMERGEIQISGNVKNNLGQNMKDGKIIVNGDAEDRVGVDMKGGEIIIYGKAGANIGWDSEDGIIRISQEYKSIAPNSKATIYIWDKEKEEWKKISNVDYNFSKDFTKELYLHNYFPSVHTVYDEINIRRPFGINNIIYDTPSMIDHMRNPKKDEIYDIFIRSLKDIVKERESFNLSFESDSFLKEILPILSNINKVKNSSKRVKIKDDDKTDVSEVLRDHLNL